MLIFYALKFKEMHGDDRICSTCLNETSIDFYTMGWRCFMNIFKTCLFDDVIVRVWNDKMKILLWMIKMNVFTHFYQKMDKTILGKNFTRD